MDERLRIGAQSMAAKQIRQNAGLQTMKFVRFANRYVDELEEILFDRAVPKGQRVRKWALRKPPQGKKF